MVSRPGERFDVHSTRKPASANVWACCVPSEPRSPVGRDGHRGEQAALPAEDGGAGQQERAEVLGEQLPDGGGHVQVAAGPALLRPVDVGIVVDGAISAASASSARVGGISAISAISASSASAGVLGSPGPFRPGRLHETWLPVVIGPSGASGGRHAGEHDDGPSARAASVSTASSRWADIRPGGDGGVRSARRPRAPLRARRCGPWRSRPQRLVAGGRGLFAGGDGLGRRRPWPGRGRPGLVGEGVTAWSRAAMPAPGRPGPLAASSAAEARATHSAAVERPRGRRPSPRWRAAMAFRAFWRSRSRSRRAASASAKRSWVRARSRSRSFRATVRRPSRLRTCTGAMSTAWRAASSSASRPAMVSSNSAHSGPRLTGRRLLAAPGAELGDAPEHALDVRHASPPSERSPSGSSDAAGTRGVISNQHNVNSPPYLDIPPTNRQMAWIGTSRADRPSEKSEKSDSSAKSSGVTGGSSRETVSTSPSGDSTRQGGVMLFNLHLWEAPVRNLDWVTSAFGYR